MSNPFLVCLALFLALTFGASAEPWPKPDKLIGFWPLGSKYRLQDVGPNHYDGEAQDQSFTTGPFGGWESAASPTANNVKLLRLINRKISVLSSSFTVTLFFKRSGAATSGGLFEFLDGDWKNRAFQFRYEDPTTIEVSANTVSIAHITMFEPVDGWTYVAMVYNHTDATLTVYDQNGVLLEPTFKPQLRNSLLYSNSGIRLGYSTRFAQGLPISDAIACLMVFSAALDYEDVLKAHDACEMFDSAYAPRTTQTTKPTITPEITTTTVLGPTTPKDKALQIELREAAKVGDLDKIRKLLQLGVLDVDWVGEYDYDDTGPAPPVQDATTLIHALHRNPNNTYEIVRLLLDYGANVNAKEIMHGFTPLILASLHGQVDTVRLLLDRGADMSATTKFDARTAFMWAFHYERFDTIALLVSRGADINQKDKDGRPALIKAVLKANLDTVRFLLDLGADVNATDAHNDTAFTNAILKDDLVTARFLLDRGAFCNADDLKTLQARLRQCAQDGELEQVRHLLQLGILNANWVGEHDFDDNGQVPPVQFATALIHATHRNANNLYEIVRLLLDHGADPNAKEAVREMTALMFSAFHGQTETARLLLDHGADMEAGTKFDAWTAFMWAADQDKLGVIRLLVNRSADVNARTKDGKTPLMKAVINGKVETARFLLDNGADVNATDSFDNSASAIALRNGDTDMVALLLERGANFNDGDLRNLQVNLREAAKQGDIEKLGKLLNLNILDVNWVDELFDYDDSGTGPAVQQATALIHVVHRNPKTVLEIVRLLLEHGADVNAKESLYGFTPLMIASLQGQVETVPLLLDGGAQINARSRMNGWSAFMWAVDYQQLDVLVLLSKRGADVAAMDDDGKTSLCQAIIKHNMAIAKFLVESTGLDVNAIDNEERSALMYAVHEGSLEMIEFLLNNGANIDAKDKNEHTALVHAAMEEKADIFRLLLKHGASLDGCDVLQWPLCNYTATETTQSPTTSSSALEDLQIQLREAAKNGELGLVQNLLRLGILDVNWRQGNDYEQGCQEFCVQFGTALIHAARSNSSNTYEIVRLLLDNGAKVDLTDDLNYYTPLILAAHNGQKETVDLLLDRGADINATSKNGFTAIRAAANGNHFGLVQWLLQRGADYEVLHVELREAAKWGNMDQLRKLLDLDILDVNWHRTGDRDCAPYLRCVDDGTALVHATNRNPSNVYDVIECLVTKGADVNMKEQWAGFFPLMFVAWDDHLETVTFLLNQGADINAKSSDGSTSLMRAAHEGHLEMATLLLDRGADIDAKTNDGQTAITVAARNGKLKMVKLLLDRGANIDE